MSNPRDINIDVVGHDKTERAMRSAANNLDQLKRKVNDVDRAGKKTDFDKRMEKIGKATGQAALSVAKFASTTAAVSGLLIQASVGAARGLVAVTHAALGIAPAAAALPAIAAGLGLIALTARMALPALQAGVQPVTTAFTSLQATVGSLASRGLKSLATGFVAVNFPTIRTAMESIARSMNGIVLTVGKWVNSAPGQQAIRTISEATARAFATAAPHLSALVVSMGNLVARVGAPAMQGFGRLVGTIADGLKRMMDNVTRGDVVTAFNNLQQMGIKVKAAFDQIKLVVGWIIDHQAQLKQVATGLQIAALATSVATENWAGAVIAAFGLVVSNWGTIKSTFSKAVPWWSSVWSAISNDPSIRRMATAISDAVHTAWANFSSTFNQFAPKMDQVTGDWKEAWGVWGPIVASAFEAIKPAIGAIGYLLGGLVAAMLWVSIGAAKMTTAIGTAFAQIATAVLMGVQSVLIDMSYMVKGMGDAVRGVPKVGDSLAAPFDNAAASILGATGKIQSAIDGLHGTTVGIDIVTTYETRGAPPRGTPANSMARLYANKPLPTGYSESSWQAVDSSQGWSGRAASSVMNPTFTVDNRIEIDGSAIAAVARTVVRGENGRQAYRARTGLR